ncbi:MAG: hypothetical protein Q9M91_03850 [Candidatus Dojkabacteria bacterium]|nr:hypothetical protein [Candidatus Dojkabacteria bacterium]MDQ7020947.1 hypothetical protein [Candidatus Dojkabacteria bacterium]
MIRDFGTNGRVLNFDQTEEARFNAFTDQDNIEIIEDVDNNLNELRLSNITIDGNIIPFTGGITTVGLDEDFSPVEVGNEDSIGTFTVNNRTGDVTFTPTDLNYSGQIPNIVFTISDPQGLPTSYNTQLNISPVGDFEKSDRADFMKRSDTNSKGKPIVQAA